MTRTVTCQCCGAQVQADPLKAHADEAEANGVKRSTFYNRISRGATVDEAKAPMKAKGYTEDDVAEAEANGINRKAFQQRISMGWSLDDAKYRKKGQRKPVDPFMAEAKRRGIDGNTFRNRVRRGWSKAKAAVTPKQVQYREWNYQ